MVLCSKRSFCDQGISNRCRITSEVFVRKIFNLLYFFMYVSKLVVAALVQELKNLQLTVVALSFIGGNVSLLSTFIKSNHLPKFRMSFRLLSILT